MPAVAVPGVTLLTLICSIQAHRGPPGKQVGEKLAGALPLARCLLEHGASVDAPKWDGQSPLWVAANFGIVDYVRGALLHGALPRRRG